jgi:hypothetical protein
MDVAYIFLGLGFFALTRWMMHGFGKLTGE